MIKIVDNEVVEKSLPNMGQLNNGSTVFNYDKLDKETLKEEGWTDYIDNPPEYNDATHYLAEDGFELEGEGLPVKRYRIMEKEKTEVEILQEEMNEAILELTMLISMGGMI